MQWASQINYLHIDLVSELIFQTVERENGVVGQAGRQAGIVTWAVTWAISCCLSLVLTIVLSSLSHSQMSVV